MKVESKFTIDNVIVQKVGNISNLDVFIQTINDYDVRIFFVNKNGIVVGNIDVTAECSQNTGFIDDILLNTVFLNKHE